MSKATQRKKTKTTTMTRETTRPMMSTWTSRTTRSSRSWTTMSNSSSENNKIYRSSRDSGVLTRRSIWRITRSWRRSCCRSWACWRIRTLSRCMTESCLCARRMRIRWRSLYRLLRRMWGFWSLWELWIIPCFWSFCRSLRIVKLILSSWLIN